MQDDNKLLEQLVTSLSSQQSCSKFEQAVDNLSLKLSASWEQAVRTHPVDKLLEQHCYKSAAGLLQLVRFLYVCSVEALSDLLQGCSNKSDTVMI